LDEKSGETLPRSSSSCISGKDTFLGECALSTEACGHLNASVPAGMRVYAVGDIHGRLDLLDELLSLIAADNAERGEAETKLVFLGDYVDRGPNSKGVVSRLLGGFGPGIEPVFLKGNHEDLLLKFLDQPEAGLNWLYNGGDVSLFSYGVEASVIHDAFFLGRAGLVEARADFRKLLPDDHQQFYRNLRLSFRAGGYFFAHAGIRPGVALDQQAEADLMWIRDEFLRHLGGFEAAVVHGHTPTQEPEDLPNRICIDTLAFASGRLTAVGLEGERRWFLST
jgi:serine/threonine protein phosphatase 1